MTTFSRSNALAWMRRNAREFVDDCGEIDHTGLAEQCAREFEVDQLGGPLDDENHWIWDLALKIK